MKPKLAAGLRRCAPAPASEGALLALAQDARAALTAGVLKRLARADTPFHSLLA